MKPNTSTGRHHRTEPAWKMPPGTVYWSENIRTPGFIRVWGAAK